MTYDSNNSSIPKRKSVCVIHTGAEEVFTFKRLVDYSSHADARFEFIEVVDHPVDSEEAAEAGVNENLVERMAHGDYVMLLAGEKTSGLSGMGLQALLTGLYMRRPIIVVNLDGCRHCDPSRLPRELEQRLFLCISSEFPVLQHALESWRDEAFRLSSMDQTHAAVYPPEMYQTLLPEDTASALDNIHRRIAL